MIQTRCTGVIYFIVGMFKLFFEKLGRYNIAKVLLGAYNRLSVILEGK